MPIEPRIHIQVDENGHVTRVTRDAGMAGAPIDPIRITNLAAQLWQDRGARWRTSQTHCGLVFHDDDQFARMQMGLQAQSPVCTEESDGSALERLGGALVGVVDPRAWARVGLVIAGGHGLSHAADYFKQVIACGSWD